MRTKGPFCNTLGQFLASDNGTRINKRGISLRSFVRGHVPCVRNARKESIHDWRGHDLICL